MIPTRLMPVADCEKLVRLACKLNAKAQPHIKPRFKWSGDAKN